MIDEKLNKIVGDILDIDDREVSDELTPETTENWDSMHHLRLVTAIEQEFSISFSMNEIQSIQKISRLRELVNHHVKSL